MFTELHSLAQAASLLISVAAEGDALRVTVNAAPAAKSGPAMHPLVLVGTPAELDAGFAGAVQIFEPSAMPLLEQARAAADANATKGKSAPKASSKDASSSAQAAPKRGPGRPPKNSAGATEKAEAPLPPQGANADASDDGSTPEFDPRQMSLVDGERSTAAAEADSTPATASQPPSDAESGREPSTDPRDTGIDMPI